MGGSFYHHKPTLKVLMSHPNFKLPIVPKTTNRNVDMIIDYVTEFIAQVISPSPQEDLEDVDIPCTEMAKLLRTSIRGKLKKNLRNIKNEIFIQSKKN